MNELSNIIKNSKFQVIPGIFIYTKVKSRPQGNHFLVAEDTDEFTVVTTSDRLSELDVIERNKDDYALIALNVSIPFYSVGFLAKVSKVIAENGLNILIVSTYSKDYILVKYTGLEIVERILTDLGLTKK